MKGAALLNLLIMATANTKNRSKRGRNNGNRWKMFHRQAAAAFGIIKRDSTIFHMLTFISLTKKIFKALSGVCRDYLIVFGTFPLFKL